jgi:predicted amidohydrolase
MRPWPILVLLAGVTCATAAADPATVRVAALQCSSPMGSTAANTSNLVALIRQAARDGAKIIVTPECAVQGYMAPLAWASWSTGTNDAWQVARVAEPIPGPTTRTFGALAKELGVYLCVGLIEVAGREFFNAQVLLAPDGTLAARHRKTSLWTPGDSAWCTRSGERPQVVSTPYGRLGLMICFEVHTLPARMAEAKPDIILYSVAWYGPNEKDWFGNQLPQRVSARLGCGLVTANWAGGDVRATWPGLGYSCVIGGDGHVLAMARTVVGNEIVMVDLPVGQAQPAASPPAGKAETPRSSARRSP